MTKHYVGGKRLMWKVDLGQIITCHFKKFRQHSVGKRVQMRGFEQKSEIRGMPIKGLGGEKW